MTRPGLNTNSMAKAYRMTFGIPVGRQDSPFDGRRVGLRGLDAACIAAYSGVNSGAPGSLWSLCRAFSATNASNGTTQVPRQSGSAAIDA